VIQLQSFARLNGDPALLAVDRVVGELRRGRVACVTAAPANAAVLVAAAETARQTVLAALRDCGSVTLVLASERATALGVDSGAPATRLALPPEADAALVMALTAGAITPVLTGRAAALQATPAGAAEVAAVALAKHAGLLPAALAVPLPTAAAAAMASSPAAVAEPLLRVDAADIARFEQPQDVDLERVSDARVPLEDSEDCELVVFRDARNGTEHLAVVLGRPDLAAPVRVRMHSSCLTGDLLGSLRCDCGDQLRRAVQQLSGEGGGVLLYLSQEGRGIGLASKLRAYRLQDAGLDTLDANNHLGFRVDERSFDMAAQMLRALGVARIRLLTSNPWKVKALRAAGIEVVAQEPLHGRVNRHNARYIQVKQERAGHLPRDLSAARGPERE
jgi:GTP cyclohydrolase II